MPNRTLTTIDGNEAAAHIVYLTNEVIAIWVVDHPEEYPWSSYRWGFEDNPAGNIRWHHPKEFYPTGPKKVSNYFLYSMKAAHFLNHNSQPNHSTPVENLRHIIQQNA